MKKFSIFPLITSVSLNLASAPKTALDLTEPRLNDIYEMLDTEDLIKLGHISQELGVLIAGKLHDKILRDIKHNKDLIASSLEACIRHIEKSIICIELDCEGNSLDRLIRSNDHQIRLSIGIFADKYWDLLNINLNIQPLILAESGAGNDLWTCELSGVKYILNQDQTKFIGVIQQGTGIPQLHLHESKPKNRRNLCTLYFLPYQLQDADVNFQRTRLSMIWEVFQTEARFYERWAKRMPNIMAASTRAEENVMIEDTELPNVADMSQDSHETEPQSFFSSLWSWITNFAQQVYDWVIWW